MCPTEKMGEIHKIIPLGPTNCVFVQLMIVSYKSLILFFSTLRLLGETGAHWIKKYELVASFT